MMRLVVEGNAQSGPEPDPALTLALAQALRWWGDLVERRYATMGALHAIELLVGFGAGFDAFHRALGFQQVGEATLPSGQAVRYLEAFIGDSSVTEHEA